MEDDAVKSRKRFFDVYLLALVSVFLLVSAVSLLLLD